MTTYKKIIKSFLFEEQYRREMDLTHGVRLNPKMNRLEIQTVSGYYPMTANLYMKTKLTTPKACRGWLGFFVISENQKVSGTVVTSIRFKLNDGTNDLYWNGASWTVASLSNWNTEQEIADNIASYTSQSIQIIINLSTQNEGYSPFIYEARLLYQTDINFMSDYIVDSFKNDILETLMPISNYKFTSLGETSKELKFKTPYEIIGIDAVYNETTDPNYFSPLSSISFDTSTNILTLPAQTAGNIILVKFIWRLPVILTQSRDYSEIAQIPAMLIEDTSIENTKFLSTKQYVINKATGDGYSIGNIFQGEIRLSLYIMTDKMKDLHILCDEFEKYFSNTKYLRSRGQDENFPYKLITIFNDSTLPSRKEIYSARFIVVIANAVFYTEDAKQITGVNRFVVTGGNVTLEVTP